jgi:hypothetical protein
MASLKNMFSLTPHKAVYDTQNGAKWREYDVTIAIARIALILSIGSLALTFAVVVHHG